MSVYTSKQSVSDEVYSKIGVKIGDELPLHSIGYPLIYFCEDNTVLCPECARVVANGKLSFDSIICNVDIYWEGSNAYCDVCNVEIESAYGECV